MTAASRSHCDSVVLPRATAAAAALAFAHRPETSQVPFQPRRRTGECISTMPGS